MNDWQATDQQALERLVDGELPEQQRRALLLQLESDPEGWRRCALAFLEEQTLRSGVRSFLVEQTPPDKVGPVVPETKPVARAATWLAVAAGLFVAFAAGRLAVPTPSPSPTTIAAVAPGAELSAPPAEEPEVIVQAEPEPAREGDIITLLVRDADGVDQRVRVPLMEAGSEPVPWGDDGRLSGLRGRLMDEGFELRRRRRIAPLFFEDRDRIVPMAVPVEDTYLVPVSRPVY